MKIEYTDLDHAQVLIFGHDPQKVDAGNLFLAQKGLIVCLELMLLSIKGQRIQTISS